MKEAPALRVRGGVENAKTQVSLSNVNAMPVRKKCTLTLKLHVQEGGTDEHDVWNLKFQRLGMSWSGPESYRCPPPKLKEIVKGSTNLIEQFDHEEHDSAKLFRRVMYVAHLASGKVVILHPGGRSLFNHDYPGQCGTALNPHHRTCNLCLSTSRPYLGKPAC